MRPLVLGLLVVGALAACGSALPQTRYYQLAPPPTLAPAPAGPTAGAGAGAVLAVEPLSADGAYDDERIVYRTDPVRLDYYQYHRWSEPPGAMLGAYVERALARSGQFRAVVHDTTADTAAVLGGRVTALEEIDDDKTHWTGHVALELTLTDGASGAILWSRAYEQRVPLAAQTPEGLARAVGVAMERIVRDAAPAIASYLPVRSISASRASICAGVSAPSISQPLRE